MNQTQIPRDLEYALRESEERYRSLFTQINEGLALHEIICDSSGKPVDYRFLDINPAFEQFTGLSREHVIGRTVLEIMPDIEPYWIETYGEVALTGKPKHFQNFSQSLGKYYNVISFCPKPGQFAALFIDITEQKRLQEEAREAAAHIELQRRLIEQREQERLQIAQELHDGPIQGLTAVTYALQTLTGSLQDAKVMEELNGILQAIMAQITDLRAFSQELRPPLLIQFGLEKAIQAHLENYQQKHPEVCIHLESLLNGEQLTETIQLVLYRIYQEALNNVAKHAQASQVEIQLRVEKERVLLTIRDNGVGFIPPKDWLELTQQGHLGLVGMRERAEAVGGSVKIISAPTQGTKIFVSVPVLNR